MINDWFVELITFCIDRDFFTCKCYSIFLYHNMRFAKNKICIKYFINIIEFFIWHVLNMTSIPYKIVEVNIKSLYLTNNRTWLNQLKYENKYMHIFIKFYSSTHIHFVLL